MKKSKITPIGALRLKPEAAKRKLITYHGFKLSDFYDNTLICQDCVELSSVDILEEIQLTHKEQYENNVFNTKYLI